jgi:hypothetical protein
MGALLAPVQTETSLATQIPASVPWALPWVAVRQRFSQFHQNIGLTLLQQVDGWTKLNGVLTARRVGQKCLSCRPAGSHARAARLTFLRKLLIVS